MILNKKELWDLVRCSEWLHDDMDTKIETEEFKHLTDKLTKLHATGKKRFTVK